MRARRTGGLDARHSLRVALATAALLLAGLALALPPRSAAAAGVCPNAEFRTGPSAALPDCRAYELVTPVDKNGGTVVDGALSMVPAGEGLTLLSFETLLPGTGDNLSDTFYFTGRTPAGWTTTPEMPPASEYLTPITGTQALTFDDLDGVSLDGGGTLWQLRRHGQPVGEEGLYLEPAPGAALVEVGPFQQPAYYSGDLRYIFFEDATEYIGAANSAPISFALDESGNPLSGCVLGGPAGRGGSTYHNPASVAGSTVFFTCGGELYARLQNGQPGAHTLALAAGAAFLGAAEDGSRVFYEQAENIFEYDLDAAAGEQVVRVSGGDSTVSNPLAEVQGLVQLSEDGSHVYFVADGVLSRNANAEGHTAAQGAHNLYVFDTETRQTAFIAALPDADSALWGEFALGEYASPSDVTPDGRFLVFAGSGDLTPDDTSSVQQVFEYDAQAGSLVRVSVGQGGYNDNGNTDVNPAEIVFPDYGPVGYQQVGGPSQYWSRLTVAEDGTAFFQSSDALTPQAIDDPHNVIHNVYEYRDGSVYLISDGQDATLGVLQSEGGIAHLIGADASGRDVFFETSDGLVPQDTNGSPDIYDARVDGGIPAPAAVVGCEGDECQGPLSAAPVLLSPGSEFQAGGGNVGAASVSEPATAAKTKSKVKRKGKKTKRKTQKAGAKSSSKRSEGGRR